MKKNAGHKRFKAVLVLCCIECFSFAQQGIQEKFKISSSVNLLNEAHLFVKSPLVSVQSNTQNLGFGSVIAPPYFCYPFTAVISLYNENVTMQHYDWFPSYCIQYGQRMHGIETRLKITPLNDQRGVMAELTIENTNNHQENIPIAWKLSGKAGISRNWEWYPPAAMHGTTLNYLTDKKNHLLLSSDSVMLIFKSELAESKGENNSLQANVLLQAKQKKNIVFVLLAGPEEPELFKQMDEILADPENIQNKAITKTDEVLGTFISKMPRLEGASEPLTDFYLRGISTLSTCRWQVPEFPINPWYAESGLDGGALNNYCWGLAYITRTMAMIDPSAIRQLLLAYVKADLAQTYAINPANGKGMGVLYSYNFYSIIRATYEYVMITGDYSILTESAGNKDLLGYLFHFCLLNDDLTRNPELIDFGGNHNLLELKRTQNYTGYTPSPNAERLLIYRYLTALYRIAGRQMPYDLTGRSNHLQKIIQGQLWDPENKWLSALGKNGEKKTAWSLQVFDVLRTGALTKEQEDEIVSHLNDREFLSAYGIHSLAKTDPGYDETDVDWGGPGVYAGDTPELIEDLLLTGYVKEGIDLLERILWWREFPYYPQAIRADRKGYREDGRPNVIAGLATTQCIIFGLFGIDVTAESIIIHPVCHSALKGTSLKGFTIRGITLDVSVSGDGLTYEIRNAEKTTKYSLGETAEILF